MTRERQGITLAHIAESTKIRASLFAALERNDLRAWPKAIYRRAYFREYARVVGVPIDETCDEFNRLFTDEPMAARSTSVSTAPAAPAAPAEDLRLVLDTEWHGPRRAVLTRLCSALLDAGFVAIVSTAMMFAAGIDASVCIAAVTMAYFSLGTIIFGESPATWILSKRESLFAAVAPAAPETQEPSGDPETRTWISDARRVGPSPQLRVRFKV